MQTVDTVASLRGALRQWRGKGETIGFVPTMGNLHPGHVHLIQHAKRRCDRVVVSIFVNPLQFDDQGDFSAYPRTLKEDKLKLSEIGADLLFLPTLEEVYPRGMEASTRVEVPGLSDLLCGAYRPGHFLGVTTVVTVLLNMVQPGFAFFGRKDYQQLLLIRLLVADLHLPVTIVGLDTVRAPDGLALSSRNQYLSAQERAVAPMLYQALTEAAAALQAGQADHRKVAQRGLERLGAAGFRPEYFSIHRADDLAPASTGDQKLVIVAAAWLGRARLIDNILLNLQA